MRSVYKTAYALIVAATAATAVNGTPTIAGKGGAVEIFTTPDTLAIPYRIPAIACTGKGDIVAVADYRYSRLDIGVLVDNAGNVNDGHIDIHCRVSADGGATWGETATIADGLGAASADAFHTGFGDPALAADRESEEVVMLCCSGDVSFFQGKRDNHQGIAVFHSLDGGRTWGEPADVNESFYAQLDDCVHGPVRAMFVGSGKIHQSRYVKVGKYYRLYCAVLVRTRDNLRSNYVYYSDDFGRTWTLLGDPNEPPIITGGDEPKAEELPDGSVVVSSRIRDGRKYNIYYFTDAATGEGLWGESAISDNSNNGVAAESNSTNGELLILPATRVADGQPTWVALQSIPLGPGRSHVGIYYKELASRQDYINPAAFATDWDGSCMVTEMGSAYSTMALQADGRVAFFYEEDTYQAVSGGGFTLIYVPLTLAEITGGKYDLDSGRW